MKQIFTLVAMILIFTLTFVGIGLYIFSFNDSQPEITNYDLTSNSYAIGEVVFSLNETLIITTFDYKEGYDILGVYVVYENTSTKEVNFGSNNFSCFVDKINCKNTSVNLMGAGIATTHLVAPSAMVQGWIYYEIPETANDITLHYTSSIDDTTLNFIIK